MGLVHRPFLPAASRAGGRQVAGGTVLAMEIGQHVMAVVLIVIGVVRSTGDGVEPPVAIVTGALLLAWHTAWTRVPAGSLSRRLAVGWLVVLAVLWVGAVAVSDEFLWLAFLLWLLAGHLLPLVWGLLFSASVFAVVALAPILHLGSTGYASVFGPLVGGVFAFGISRGYLRLLYDAAERERLVTSLTRAQQEMADLQDELARAQRRSGARAERTRLSRDIHDTVAQSLSSIRLLAHAGSGRTADQDAARTLAQVEALAGDSLGDVRRIVAALAPAGLEGQALPAALRRMLDRAHDETGLLVDLHVDESLPILATEVEVVLLRAAQSALANVRQHARASRVVMSLIDAGDTVRLDVHDDGDGFDVAAWEERGDASASYGLRFLRARLRERGGGLDIESIPGQGTAIGAHVPLHAVAAPVDAVGEPGAPESGGGTR